MNRAFLIVIIPAILTSFCWLAIEWGWGAAMLVTCVEIAVVAMGVAYQIRRERGLQSGRAEPEASGEAGNR
ncbi:MAG: hypothetical protein ACREQC_15010 [Candidatus Binataceae bacterium]